LKIGVWDIGPEKPVKPAKPVVSKAVRPGSVEYDLEQIELRSAVENYEKQLTAYLAQVKDFEQWHACHSGPVILEQWSADWAGRPHLPCPPSPGQTSAEMHRLEVFAHVRVETLKHLADRVGGGLRRETQPKPFGSASQRAGHARIHARIASAGQQKPKMKSIGKSTSIWRKPGYTAIRLATQNRDPPGRISPDRATFFDKIRNPQRRPKWL
jgi:hypothetical protein